LKISWAARLTIPPVTGRLDLFEDLLGGPLDDTTGDGQAGALLEEQVDLAGGLVGISRIPK